MPLPLMVLKRSALDHNGRVFGEYLRANGLSLAPHGKTTMTPQIFATQLGDGAWGMTAATVNQVQLMRAYGVGRIVLANQLIGRAHVRYIAAEINRDPDFEFYFFLDSVAQLENISRHLDGIELHRPLRPLLEVGVAGGRTGARTLAEALTVAGAIAAADPARFRFAGIATYEGVVPDLARSTDGVGDLSDFVIEVARSVPASLYADLDQLIVTAGGSSYFDIVADRLKALALDVPVRVLLRSGCYVTHDDGGYETAHQRALADPRRHPTADLEPALEVWAYVQSIPEPGLALLTMGKRDVPYDSGLPVPTRRYRPGAGFLPVGEATVFNTNDQHAYVRLPAETEWRVGDLVGSGISHPCTAFDKWRFIPVVDDDYGVIDGMLTFF
jgi:D-serine dehydratase